MAKEYDIVRFFRKPQRGGNKQRIIRKGVTLKEAKEWCSRPDTQKAGEWFDGFREVIK